MTDLPLSYPLVVERIPEGGKTVVVTADETSRAALARQISSPGIAELVANFELTRRGRRVTLEGHLKAKLTRVCVVTLEPFEVVVDEPMAMKFAEPPRDDKRTEIEIKAASEDPPDHIIDGKIDLGQVASEFLMLALDPYPRKPNVVFTETVVEVAPKSPFAALAALKKT
jgi:uncharacterized metal-binding protein YceD (DUF177 family)